MPFGYLGGDEAAFSRDIVIRRFGAKKRSFLCLSPYSMSTNYLALRSSAAVNLTLSTLTGSTITAPTVIVSTLRGSTMLGTTLAISTLTVSSINNNAPGTGTGSFSTLTVSSLVSVSSISSASTMYTSSLVTTGSVGVGTTAPLFTFDVASSSQNTADLTVLSNTTYGSFGQTWTTISGPPTATWCGVALSATGQYQTAVYGNYANAGGVYYSNNYGATWTAGTITANQQYQTVAMSASGQYQVTGVNGNGGKIYVSTDYGVTWNIVSSSYTGLWNGFGVSATGQYMVGVLYYYSSFLGYIYYSNDYGVSWTQGTGLSSTTLLFTGVCCSGSGQYQTACANGGGLWYSSNYGASWTVASGTGSLVWVGVCCSLSGQYQSACVLNGTIYYSSNYGVTWTSSGVANAAWQDICCDSTAQYQLCTVSNGKVWYSTNYGQSWTISTSATATWSRPRMSRYGQYSTALIYNGGIASSNLSSVNQPFLRLGCGSSGNQAGIILNTWNARPGGPSCQIMSMDDGGFSSHMAFFSAASGSAGYTVSTERMRITANGSVGIGTAVPAANVHVYDPTTSSSAVPLMVLSPNISAGGAQYLYFGTANSSNNTAQLGWCNVGAGSASNYAFLQIFGKANIMTWQASTGYVGIGTTNPGDILSLYSSSNLSFRISNTNAGYYQVGLANAGGQYSSHAVAGDSVVRAVSGNLILQTGSGNSGIYINSSNNVGIGTSAPIGALDVYGTCRVLSRPYVAFTSGTSIELIYDGGGNLVCGTRSVTVPTLTTANMNYVAASHNFYIGGQGATSAMFINTIGQIGIGTTVTQNNMLRVFGGNNNSGISLGDFQGTAGIKYIGLTAESNGTIVDTSSGFAGITWGPARDGGTSSYMAFHTHGYGVTSGERMRIDKDGRVGIGTNVPLSRLMVHAFGNGVSTTDWIAGAFGPSASLPRVVLGTYGSNAIIGAHNSTLDQWRDLTINPGGNVSMPGTLSKGGGTFDIQHPLFTDAKKRLVHSFVEGPRCDLIYRGKTTLVNGTAIVDINKECTHSPECAMDDGTFEALCGNPQIFLQNNQSFDRVRGTIIGSRLTITCENPVSIVIEWMVIAERIDPFIKKWDRTNSDGYLVTQYTMDHEPLNMATNYDSTV